MSSAQEYRDSGFMDFGELTERIGIPSHIDPGFVASRLQSPLSKFRLIMIMQGLIVLPDDRKARSMYSLEAMYFLAAYLNWCDVFQRVSAFEASDFYRAFFEGESRAISKIPPAMRRRYRKMLADQVDT